jgi:crotonobetainyl-CoA:carnitine CoA-transferase CaiB-like acyl-CoA transferase
MDALEGLTVVDCTAGIAGPYTTKVLADFGARIVKVERTGGDPARALPPFLHDEAGPDRSATFQFLNTNKESIVLNLSSAGGRSILARLVARADLVVTSSSPATATRLGLDYAELSKHTPAPVVSLTNFGHTGPYRDYSLSETTLFAMGGEMHGHGLAGREPLKMGGTAALLQCGAMGAVAALGAIHAWEQHGIGQHVDLALFEVQANSVDRRNSNILAYRFSGRIPERPAGSSAGIAGGIYPVSDGYVEVTAGGGNYWSRFVEMIGNETLREPRWQSPALALSPAAKEEADAIVYPWMLSHTRAEVWEKARKAHAMVAPLYSGKDVFEDTAFRERGLWAEIEHAVLGKLPMLGRPYTLEKTPWRLRRPAPKLGQDTQAVLRDLGYSEDETARLRADGAAG